MKSSETAVIKQIIVFSILAVVLGLLYGEFKSLLSLVNDRSLSNK